MSKKIKNPNDLKKLNDRLVKNKKELEKGSKEILVCAGSGCIASGSLEVSKALKEAIKKNGLENKAKVVETGCMGPCVIGPVAMINPDGVFYQNVKADDAEEIVKSHILKGEIVERLIPKNSPENKLVSSLKEMDFFKNQVKICLRNCGVIDPLNIEDYIAHDGYLALLKVLTEMTGDQVVEQIKNSGLRGRGGGGFSTGLKWSFAKKAKGEIKYVLCNADEGDPGAFMDRSVLEGDPHSVIEAMAIAGYTIGASQGFVYVRAEYPLAVKNLGIAIEQAREYGLLGKNILGKGFEFDLEIRMGSGAFVCGEETALITSIEGNRGEPRPRPPYPVNQGLWGKPSLLNNVETYANIPAIILNGYEWYAQYGTEKGKGTKVFALAGAIKNSGLVEVPIGVSLGDVVFDIGGGIPNGKEFKAAQLGGPSGGCIPKEHLNVPIEYESLIELGAIMGSGGLIVMDEDSCMVDVARFFLEFTQEESCGKCPPCRVGTKRMLEIVTDICEGRGREGDIERLIELGNKIMDTALCGLGQTAPNPVLSTIRYFRSEYEAHIREKRCPAGVCADLVRAPCQNACPADVDVPGFVSLLGEQRYEEALILHRERNPFPEICARVCFHPCEHKCRRASLDSPVSIRYAKRFLGDQEETPALPEFLKNSENENKKIAIIGSGPAGLSCAYFLARLGYKPEIFEAEEKPGGMMVQTIPEYRLPRKVIEKEIKMIEHIGVKIRTGVRLGKDITLKGLKKDGYDAVFIGVGAPRGSLLGIPGQETNGIVDAIEFLRNYNLKKSQKTGKKVAVIGGGNAAIDAARTALRLGADEVTILYRRTRAQMPAWKEEIEEAEKEGVILKTLVAPLEIVSKDGKVLGIKCTGMSLGGFDRSGRRRPSPMKGSEFVFEADQVITAIGQELDAGDILGDSGLETDKNNYIKSDSLTGRTSLDWVFSGGDCVTGPASIVQAIGAGEKAAVSIDKFLTGEEHAFWRKEKASSVAFNPDDDPVATPRANIETIPVADRKNNFAEVELPWSLMVAVNEAKRCLRCDYREENKN